MTEEAACNTAAPSPNVAKRLASLDWKAAEQSLDERGFALLAGVLTQAECRVAADWYGDSERFRSRVIMARHNFGSGEYQYFDYPLPPLVAGLRESAYPPLVKIANTWAQRLGYEVRYPAQLQDFTALCHHHGQHRATPLLLRYGRGDYNRLHQDLYGDLFFPMQMVILLSRPGHDFTGGGFVLTEQKPRSQSRAEVIPLNQGDACVFAVSTRPARGARGFYRATMRHGVSTVLSGERLTLGIIFHDAR